MASLGLVYDDEEMHQKFRETSSGREQVTFEQFIRFMVDETEDQNTAEQVFESFKEVADGKVRASSIITLTPANLEQPYVTELDLRHSLVPDEVIDDLIASMPEHKGPDLQEDRDLPKYDYITYMERYMNAKREEQQRAEEQVNGG